MTLIVAAVLTWLLLNGLFVVGMTYLSRREVDAAQGLGAPQGVIVLGRDRLLESAATGPQDPAVPTPRSA